MRYQPIVDCQQRRLVASEALLRGPNGESTGQVFEQVNSDNLYRFDQSCRVKAITLAKQLNMAERLHINFMPNAVYDPKLCIRTTLAAAQECGFATDKIVFEVVEGQKITDHAHLKRIIRSYAEMGFYTAIDDFGAGYAGLNMLAEYPPHIIKLDRLLIRDIHANRIKQVIVRASIEVCRELAIELLAEDVERREEYPWLKIAGIVFFQGYYFARPGFECLPGVASEVYD
ncbi:MAG: EAL domain-containing protein [Gammaproteobacteria bacterium]|nr:EAL domain-containing protein [Gammaproteobacteria bacterium]